MIELIRLTKRRAVRAAFAAAALSLAATATAAATADAGLARRIRLAEDRAEIRALLIDYGRHLDRLDFHAYGALFARRGEWIGGGPPAVGPAEIEARMAKTFGPGSGVKWTSDHHIFSDPIVTVVGDRATAWSRWLFVSPSAEGRPVAMYGGHYADILVREDGRWRFGRREVVSDLAAQ